ncbi:MAG: type II toxin-antitoxin system VapC family toxin [Geminicoccaceae bacterium]|nr:MAG: type II toxin-antitoxin system VapC family toxin [Geminicoccaceae bacterium]
MIALDTNAVIAVINGRNPVVRERLEAALVGGIEVGLSSIVLFELRYGIAKSRRPRANTEVLQAFLALGISPWPFDEDDAAAAGALRSELEGRGLPIGPFDVLIAGQARHRNATVVTANRSEFERVPGLRTEDWSVPAQRG